MIFVDKKIQTKNFAKSTGAAIYGCQIGDIWDKPVLNCRYVVHPIFGLWFQTKERVQMIYFYYICCGLKRL